jgi:hypothetical protein
VGVARQVVWTRKPVNTWAEFHRVVKHPGQELLERLDDYRDSVLVSGCQRSGTTAVARLFSRTKQVADHSFGCDSELDGALLLAGYVARFTNGKHCFQTTYLNDRFPEYFLHQGFRLVWILREPRSVVYSMLHNWKRDALNRLFHACGTTRLAALDQDPSPLGRWIGPSRLDKACASYIAKTEQTFVLRERLGERMLIVDYNDLVSRTKVVLRQICDFAEVSFDEALTGHLHSRSKRRCDRLAPWQASRIDSSCRGVYETARTLLSTLECRNA